MGRESRREKETALIQQDDESAGAMFAAAAFSRIHRPRRGKGRGRSRTGEEINASMHTQCAIVTPALRMNGRTNTSLLSSATRHTHRRHHLTPAYPITLRGSPWTAISRTHAIHLQGPPSLISTT
ncbi:hypothetical protein NECAME_01396 [Necator americanus]|uniref:Uncharacterized protein n=1 Tax=Necator americanus TaxID=51031 RepID=W2TWV5_NECAM|nr:hypothetical protein NECAME_01396 [Necator americanus]ETN85507.1 hypothetical protein NECAME_01396 [Necator americanus]